MSATNPFRDPALARPAIKGEGIHAATDYPTHHVQIVVRWYAASKLYERQPGWGWHWMVTVNNTELCGQVHHGYSTDHGAYDAAVEALA